MSLQAAAFLQRPDVIDHSCRLQQLLCHVSQTRADRLSMTPNDLILVDTGHGALGRNNIGKEHGNNATLATKELENSVQVHSGNKTKTKTNEMKRHELK